LRKLASVERLSISKIDELNKLYLQIDERTKVLQGLAIDLGSVKKEIEGKTQLRDRTQKEIDKFQKVDEMQIEIDILQQSPAGIQ
jgi:hypothetical protein